MNLTRRLAEDARKNSSDPRIRAQADAYCRNADRAAQVRIENRKNRKQRLGAATLHHEEVRGAEKKSAAERRRETYDAVKGRVAHLGGLCEWQPCPRAAMDPHHIFGGKNRSSHEAPETVAGICREDHRAWEANDEETLNRAFRWARWHNFTRTMAKIEDRIMRAVETRMLLGRSGAEGER